MVETHEKASKNWICGLDNMKYAWRRTDAYIKIMLYDRRRCSHLNNWVHVRTYVRMCDKIISEILGAHEWANRDVVTWTTEYQASSEWKKPTRTPPTCFHAGRPLTSLITPFMMTRNQSTHKVVEGWVRSYISSQFVPNPLIWHQTCTVRLLCFSKHRYCSKLKIPKHKYLLLNMIQSVFKTSD